MYSKLFQRYPKETKDIIAEISNNTTMDDWGITKTKIGGLGIVRKVSSKTYELIISSGVARYFHNTTELVEHVLYQRGYC